MIQDRQLRSQSRDAGGARDDEQAVGDVLEGLQEGEFCAEIVGAEEVNLMGSRVADAVREEGVHGGGGGVGAGFAWVGESARARFRVW
jgi:hypothetical protein